MCQTAILLGNTDHLSITLGLTGRKAELMAKVPHYERDELAISEVFDALVTGTRPVYFQENESTHLWGGGSMFIAQWKEKQFAITAKHVFTNAKANPTHTRIFFPGYKVALPILGIYTPTFENYAAREDLEDIAVLRLNHEVALQDEELAWHAWRMDLFWRSAKDLAAGQQLFAVGFPSTEDRYDWDNQRVNEMPMIAIGKLSEDSLGDGLYCIETATFEHDIDGSSGGPVFARFNGLFHYVGLIIRGGTKAQKIHFIDAAFVIFVLEYACGAA
ncbi:MAG: hypothetical protein RLZZ612_2452 [Pseudomonadota bacterium]|jgi:hypothetical protein